MKVRDLIEELEAYDGDAEVRLMSQPSWPFEYSIEGLWTVEKAEHSGTSCERSEEYDPDADDEDECLACEADGFEPHEADGDVVYLLEGSQLGYGAKKAWEGGW